MLTMVSEFTKMLLIVVSVEKSAYSFCAILLKILDCQAQELELFVDESLETSSPKARCSELSWTICLVLAALNRRSVCALRTCILRTNFAECW